MGIMGVPFPVATFQLTLFTSLLQVRFFISYYCCYCFCRRSTSAIDQGFPYPASISRRIPVSVGKCRGRTRANCEIFVHRKHRYLRKSRNIELKIHPQFIRGPSASEPVPSHWPYSCQSPFWPL